MAESFFASLETEILDRAAFRTRADAVLAMYDYIELSHDTSRRHSALGYLSSAEYERRCRSNNAVA